MAVLCAVAASSTCVGGAMVEGAVRVVQEAVGAGQQGGGDEQGPLLGGQQLVCVDGDAGVAGVVRSLVTCTVKPVGGVAVGCFSARSTVVMPTSGRR